VAGADSPRHKIDGRHDDQGLGGFFSLTTRPLRPPAFLWMHKIQASKDRKLKYLLLGKLFWKISLSCFSGHAYDPDATGLAFRFESDSCALFFKKRSRSIVTQSGTVDA
jgi:hypothetical protein